MQTWYIIAFTCAAVLASGDSDAGSVSRKSAEAAATAFCQAVVSGDGAFSDWEFEGETRRRMKPLLSKRLLAHLDSIHACVRDWARNQPPGSTDKPPGVDCCVFTASADWSPTSFQLRKAELIADGRTRVTVEYRFDSPYEHARWMVALYIVKEDRRYVVDDFEGGVDRGSVSWFVLSPWPQCQNGKWVP